MLDDQGAGGATWPPLGTSQHSHILTPGRYVGAPVVEDDGEPFEEKMERLAAQLEEQFAEGARLEEQIRYNLAWLRGTERR